MVRLFFSCDVVDPNVVEKLVAFQRKVLLDNGAIRLVDASALHFTLAFLGEQRKEDVDKIVGSVNRVKIVGGTVRLRGVSALPDPEKPRVIVVRAAEGSSVLEGAAAAVRKGLADSNIWFDPRPFLPHVTLARVKSHSRRVYETLALHSDTDFGETAVTAVRLKESILTPDHPAHSVIWEMPPGDPN